MIIRRHADSVTLITQPAHAALAARLLQHWSADGLPGSPRRASILLAVEQHDTGWAEVDESLVVDESTGRLLDFVELEDAMKRETASRGIERLAADPYAAALVAQHRLHVYRRRAGQADWLAFFDATAQARDAHLRAAGAVTLAELLGDYALVRAADLASLAFCTEEAGSDPDGCRYAMRMEGTTLVVSPDPFAGRASEFELAAREMPLRRFASAADARSELARARPITLRGVVRGEQA